VFNAVLYIGVAVRMIRRALCSGAPTTPSDSSHSFPSLDNSLNLGGGDRNGCRNHCPANASDVDTVNNCALLIEALRRLCPQLEAERARDFKHGAEAGIRALTQRSI
jgi:hypothetical protein